MKNNLTQSQLLDHGWYINFDDSQRYYFISLLELLQNKNKIDTVFILKCKLFVNTTTFKIRNILIKFHKLGLIEYDENYTNIRLNDNNELFQKTENVKQTKFAENDRRKPEVCDTENIVRKPEVCDKKIAANNIYINNTSNIDSLDTNLNNNTRDSNINILFAENENEVCDVTNLKIVTTQNVENLPKTKKPKSRISEKKKNDLLANYDAVKLTDKLIDCILENHEHAKIPQKSSDEYVLNWLYPMELLMRIGSGTKDTPNPYTYDDIEDTISYIKDDNIPNSGGFCWSKVIQSVSGLSKHINKILPNLQKGVGEKNYVPDHGGQPVFSKDYKMAVELGV